MYTIDKDICVECGACQTACGYDAISDEFEITEKCVGCGDCVEICPIKAIRNGDDGDSSDPDKPREPGGDEHNDPRPKDDDDEHMFGTVVRDELISNLGGYLLENLGINNNLSLNFTAAGRANGGIAGGLGLHYPAANQLLGLVDGLTSSFTAIFKVNGTEVGRQTFSNNTPALQGRDTINLGDVSFNYPGAIDPANTYSMTVNGSVFVSAGGGITGYPTNMDIPLTVE